MMNTLPAPRATSRRAANSRTARRLTRAEAIALSFAAINADTPADQEAGNVTNVVYAANESRYVETFFSQPLTTYAVGYRDPNNIEETLGFFCPPVDVPRRFEFATFSNIEEFLSDIDDIRVPGQDFKRVEYTSGKKLGKTLNKGLTVRKDRDEIGDQAMWEETTVAKLKRRCLRNELRRALALYSASATSVAKTWDTSAGKNPDLDLATELVAIATASGINMNRVGYGDTAWLKRMISYDAQNNAGGYARAARSVQEVASSLGMSRGYVSKERYQVSSAAKAEIVGNLVFLFYAMDGMDVEDPSNIKRFVSNVLGGGQWGVYIQPIGPKFVDVTVEYYSDLQLTSALGLEKIVVS